MVRYIVLSLLLLCLATAEAVRDTSEKSIPLNRAYQPTSYGKILVHYNTDCYKPRKSLLSLDGGGLRAVMTVEVLINIEQSLKKILLEEDRKTLLTEYNKMSFVSGPNEFTVDLADFFDVISGVGSSSWIAAYLASRGGHGVSSKVFEQKEVIDKFGTLRAGSVEGLRVFFVHYAKDIYPPIRNPISVAPRLPFPDIRITAVTAPRFSAEGMEKTLEAFLGETRFLDTGNTSLIVTVFDLIRKNPLVFFGDHFQNPPELVTYLVKNDFDPRTGGIEGYKSSVQQIYGKSYLMRDVVRASGSTPAQFEAKRFTAINDRSFEVYGIDGVLIVNNPVLQSFYLVLRKDRVKEKSQLCVISIGTGITVGELDRHKDDGALQWVITSNDLLAILLEGAAEFVQTQFYSFYYLTFEKGDALKIKEPSYLRIQTVYDRNTKEGEALTAMYNFRTVEKIQELGKETVKRFSTAIYEHLKSFVIPEFCSPDPERVAIALDDEEEKAPGPSEEM